MSIGPNPTADDLAVEDEEVEGEGEEAKDAQESDSSLILCLPFVRRAQAPAPRLPALRNVQRA